MYKHRPKKASFAVSVAIICASLLVLCLLYFFGREKEEAADNKVYDSGFLVHFIDVGQGDSTLIETDGGKFVMIDAGTNACEYDLLSYLDSRNVEYIDYLFLTHPHEDHIGSADAVLDSYNVKNVVKNQRREENATCDKLDKVISQSVKHLGTKVIYPDTGDKFYVDDIEFLILSDGDGYEDINDSSLCIRMEYGDSTFIFTGDAQKVVEYDIMDSDFDIDAEVFKCGHHGSSTSNCDAFLNDIDPDIAIISCEIGNMYGHPHREVMASLNDRNITVYRTDTDSHIVLDCDSDSIERVSLLD